MAVSQKEKIFFTEHLALMIKGGTPVPEALGVLKEETRSRTFRKILNEILKRVLEGESLSKNFERHPKVFDRFFLSVVNLGEKSGTLDENLKYLSLQLRKDYDMRKKITGALLYPALILVLALAILLMIIFFVLPKVAPIFHNLQSMGVVEKFPLGTKILLDSGDWLKKYSFLIPIFLIIIFLFLKLIQRIKAIKLFFDKLVVFSPFLGQISRQLNLSRFSYSFYILLKSGTSILETIEICSKIMPNEVYKRGVASVKLNVERGEKISTGFKKNPKIFPAIFTEMFLVGEQTGSLEKSSLYLAQFYTKEADSALDNISNIIGPILLIFLGVIVLFIWLSTIIPIFKFIGEIRVR